MGPSLLLRNQIAEHKRPAYDYFEDIDIVDLQDKTLVKLDRHWSSYKASWPLADINEGFSSNSHVRDFEESLVLLLEARMAFCQSGDDSSMWVVKDPRTPILLASWLRVMEWLQIEPVFIIVHRNASDNIQSFSKKGQVPQRWAEALWQQSYVQIGKSIPSASSVYSLDFSQILENPLHVAQELKNFLGMHTDQPLVPTLKKAVDPSLPSKHSEYKLSSISEKIELCLKQSRFSDLPSPDDITLEAYKIQADLTPVSQLTLHNFGIELRKNKAMSHSSRKRICILTAELQGYGPSGGIGTAMLELAIELVSSGHLVEVWLVGSSNDPIPSSRLDSIHIRHLPGETVDQDPANFRQQIAEAVLTESFDIIHCHDWLGLGACLHLSTLETESPIVICGLHGPTQWVREGSPSISNWTKRDSTIIELEWQAIINADVLFSPSAYMKNWVSKHLGNRKYYPDIHVQLNCPSVAPNAKLSRNIDLPPESKSSLIFFGRLEERKGIVLFLDALSILGLQTHPIYFIGADAPLDGCWASQLVERRLKESGQLYQWLPDLNRDEAHAVLHAIGGIVVIPSLIENSPYTVQELLDTTLSVVTTNVGGTPELVANAQATLSEPNPRDLANKIQDALADNIDSKSIFKIKSIVDKSRIRLSWQEFHSRLPSCEFTVPRWNPKEAIVLITLDSCRLDTFQSSSTVNISKIGPLHKAKSPSYFTYASHAAMFMGFLPSTLDPVGFVNSKFAKVFRLSHSGFQASRTEESFELSGNSIITGLRRKGYFTIGTASVNWFDPATETGQQLVKDFDTFWFSGNTWSLNRQLLWIDSQLQQELDRPPFIFLNVGETHVPYWHEGASWSRDDHPCIPFQTQDRRKDCQERQRACLEFIDKQLGSLLERFSESTVIICSDHGDCWGEDGLWEHGISHEKTLSVPLLMRIRGCPIPPPTPPLSFRQRISNFARKRISKPVRCKLASALRRTKVL
ncbi:Hypothetical protein P9303_01331 [Prochlorococcus marinus str. MIT 9303]|uniref:Glycosyltransferase n=2 Tax=Prochlorococcus marinus TaxID=1219 RepID=A2C5X8_PROM3|nr:Hypothetical protein P9303_01331 [Prochlorococcus marinus str. MIT 9303]